MNPNIKKHVREKLSFGPSRILPEEMTIHEELGEGCFGKVYRGNCRSVEVAIKVPIKQSFDSKQLAAFSHEVEIMSKLFHPNVCLFMGASTVPGNIKIVTELMQGTLERLLKQGEVLALSERMKMAKDAAQGMAWLHGNDPPVIHRDLKTANLLYDENRRIKVCDFGLSETKPKGRELYDRQPKGTPLYMAPEVMKGGKITEKVDVYSFGIILWEILTQKEAFSEFEDFESFYKAMVEEEHRPPIPANCPPRLRLLMQRCWAPLPDERPLFPHIVEELEAIRVEALMRENEAKVEAKIDDPLTCTMWKKHFLLNERVKWADFVTVFYNLIKLPIPEQCLSELELEKKASSKKDLSSSSELGASDSSLARDFETLELSGLSLTELDKISTVSPTVALQVKTEKARRDYMGECSPGPSTDYSGISRGGDSSIRKSDERKRFNRLDRDCLNYYCLQAILVDDDEYVHLERVGKVLECFGPTDAGIVNRIRDLLEAPYFHGFLNSKDVDNTLRVLKRGTYLVRFSNNSKNSFCISKVSGSTAQRVVKHIVVTKNSSGWKLDNSYYESFKKLIEANAEKYFLKYPCAGSRYSWLFEEETAALGGYDTDHVDIRLTLANEAKEKSNEETIEVEDSEGPTFIQYP